MFLGGFKLGPSGFVPWKRALEEGGNNIKFNKFVNAKNIVFDTKTSFFLLLITFAFFQPLPSPRLRQQACAATLCEKRVCNGFYGLKLAAIFFPSFSALGKFSRTWTALLHAILGHKNLMSTLQSQSPCCMVVCARIMWQSTARRTIKFCRRALRINQQKWLQ